MTTDHLPNYLLVLHDKTFPLVERPLVRVFSKQNKQKFSQELSLIDWEHLYCQNDVILHLIISTTHLLSYLRNISLLLDFLKKNERQTMDNQRTEEK